MSQVTPDMGFASASPNLKKSSLVHLGFPKSSKSLDHFSVETYGDMGYPHSRKPPSWLQQIRRTWYTWQASASHTILKSSSNVAFQAHTKNAARRSGLPQIHPLPHLMKQCWVIFIYFVSPFCIHHWGKATAKPCWIYLLFQRNALQANAN